LCGSIRLFRNTATTTSFGTLQRQQTLSSPARARWLTGLLLFALSYRWQWPASIFAEIDIFTHRSCADRRGRRGGDTCGLEHGITSSQWRWHPAHSFFPSPSPFFFLFPFRRSDPHSFFTSARFDYGIFPTPHFSTRLPSPSSLGARWRRGFSRAAAHHRITTNF